MQLARTARLHATRRMFAAPFLLDATRANLKPTNTIVTHADGHRTIERHNTVVGVEGDARPRPRPRPLPLDERSIAKLPTWRLPPFDEAVLSARTSRPLRVCTWNVWFSPHRADERMAALFTIALQEAPDVICLQEVVQELASSVRSSPALCRVYNISSNDVGSYGCLILARRSLNSTFKEVVLPTRMGRSLLVADWIDEHSRKSIALGNCHFESLNNPDVRSQQLAIAGSVLESYGHSLICGDFNFDSKQNFGDWRVRKPCKLAEDFGGQASCSRPLENDMLQTLLPEYVDTWPALHADDNDGITFDGATNPYVTNSHERMRYDRILVRGMAPSRMVLLGRPTMTKDNEAAGGSSEIVPSDHYGLCVDVHAM